MVNANGKGITGANVKVGKLNVTTDESGGFYFELPANMPEVERNITVNIKGFKVWRGKFHFTGSVMMIKLEQE